MWCRTSRTVPGFRGSNHVYLGKAEYACQALLVLANRYDRNRPVRLGDITGSTPIPSRFLVQILLQLKGAGIVTTTRGASGGYHLARPPAEITLYDVLQAIEGNEQPSLLRDPSVLMNETADMANPVHTVWFRIDQEYQAFLRKRAEILRGTTLAQLASNSHAEQYII